MQIREQVHQYIDRADDRLLKMVKAMMDEYLKTENSFELSAEQKTELNRRKQLHRAGKSKSYTWEEVKAQARKQTDK